MTTTQHPLPHWIREAQQYIGVREIPGSPTAPAIAQWLQQLGAWWRDDETPWCGTYVAAIMQACDIEPPKAWYRAKAWLDWGTVLAKPAAGCVTVLERPGGGHVFFTLGRDERGRLLGLGGNQGDKVSVVPFETSRVLGHRWPAHWMALLPAGELPLLVDVGAGLASSTNEA